MSFGARLLSARNRRDFTQTRLAELAGMDASQLAHYEADGREPNADNIRRLAKALDITSDFLLELTKDTRRLSDANGK